MYLGFRTNKKQDALLFWQAIALERWVTSTGQPSYAVPTNVCLLSAYYTPGTVWCTGDTALNKNGQKSLPIENIYSSREDNKLSKKNK